MKIAGLTLEEIAVTHKDNELVKALVKELVATKEKLKKEREKMVDLVLFGDIFEAPLDLVSSKVTVTAKTDEEALIRMSIAATFYSLHKNDEEQQYGQHKDS